MTHEELCERARRWLAGTRKCKPVFSNIGSCSEIPDAIGWSSHNKWRGSTVIECKTSVSDFRNDRKKYIKYKHPEYDWYFPAGRLSQKEITEQGYSEVTIKNMGNYRFMLCPLGLIGKEDIAKYAPDHGLLVVDGRVIWKVVDAPRREYIDKDGEIRYLRFAIINGKQQFDFKGYDMLEKENEICSFA